MDIVIESPWHQIDLHVTFAGITDKADELSGPETRSNRDNASLRLALRG